MEFPLDSFEGVLLLELRVLEKALEYTTGEVREFTMVRIRQVEMAIVSITGKRVYPEVVRLDQVDLMEKEN